MNCGLRVNGQVAGSSGGGGGGSAGSSGLLRVVDLPPGMSRHTDSATPTTVYSLRTVFESAAGHEKLRVPFTLWGESLGGASAKLEVELDDGTNVESANVSVTHSAEPTAPGVVEVSRNTVAQDQVVTVRIKLSVSAASAGRKAHLRFLEIHRV